MSEIEKVCKCGCSWSNHHVDCDCPFCGYPGVCEECCDCDGFKESAASKRRRKARPKK